MILITSVSPNHKNIDVQQKCIDSWNACGFKPVTINHESENVPQYSGIEYIKTTDNFHELYGKYYLPINTMLAYGRQFDSFCITNSDIEFNGVNADKVNQLVNNGFLFSNRIDYDNISKEPYRYGFDFFAFHSNFYSVFTDTRFVLGQCHYDYWLPYKAIISGVKSYWIRNEFCYHKKHAIQYDKNSWKKTGIVFAEAESRFMNIRHNTPLLSSKVYDAIVKKSEILFYEP